MLVVAATTACLLLLGTVHGFAAPRRPYHEESHGDDFAAVHGCWAAVVAASVEDALDAGGSVDTEREEGPTGENAVASLAPILNLSGGADAAAKDADGTNGHRERNKTTGSSVGDAFSTFRVSMSKWLPANPFQKDSNDKSKEAMRKQQQDLLSSTTIQCVSAPESDILPPDVITQCAKESKLIGGKLTSETLETTADLINSQYAERGYLMNSVTGATLVPSSGAKDDAGVGRVELKVREVKMAKPSVCLRFVEKVTDVNATAEDENVVTLPSQSTDRSEEHYKTVPGRTRPSKVARLTNLRPGAHFRIDTERWAPLAASTSDGVLGGAGTATPRKGSQLFSAIHAVRPVPTGEGDTVELEIIATENKPCVSLEYGVTKSLYSDQWEGELDLKHANAFGGGEVVTVNARKGRDGERGKESGSHRWSKGVADGPLHWRMSIQDDHLGGGDAGYDLEVFRDHVGGCGSKRAVAGDVEAEEGECDSEPEGHAHQQNSFRRAGASARLRLPTPLAKFRGFSVPVPKALCARFESVDPVAERDSAQCMSCISADIGPFRHIWKVRSRQLRSDLSATATTGGRWSAGEKSKEGCDDSNMLPYTSGTITSQQRLPLSSGGSTPLADLSMRHVISVSSRHLPHHEAILLGLSSRIRGYKYNDQPQHSPQGSKKQQKQKQPHLFESVKQFVRGNLGEQIRPPIALSKALSGTLELSIPFECLVREDKQRFLPSVLGGSTIFLFGDWCLAQAQRTPSSLLLAEDASFTEKPFRHSSMGIGLRKVVQGLPLCVNACITEHNTYGLTFGMGR